MDLDTQLKEAVRAVRNRTPMNIRVGMILGSGLGALADNVENPTRISYAEIPHFPPSTVVGHAGELVIGNLEGQTVAVMKGRIHYYEGYTMQQVTFPVRLLRALGAEILVVTNSCGGINPELAAGDMMLLTDHINMMGDNPLIGHNDEKLGPRFPPMSRAYPQDLRDKAHQVALKLGHKLHEGVYLGLSGPSFETPAEIKFFQTVGADAVGMSTVPEVIVANHAGMRVVGLSCITNILHGGPSEDTHEEVLATAAGASPKMLAVLGGILQSL